MEAVNDGKVQKKVIFTANAFGTPMSYTFRSIYFSASDSSKRQREFICWLLFNCRDIVQ